MAALWKILPILTPQNKQTNYPVNKIKWTLVLFHLEEELVKKLNIVLSDVSNFQSHLLLPCSLKAADSLLDWEETPWQPRGEQTQTQGKKSV